MSIIEYIIATLAPHRCVGCEREGSLLCTTCQLQLPSPSLDACYRCKRAIRGNMVCLSCRKSTPLTALIAATRYEGMAKTVVHGLKFSRQKAAAGSMAQLITARISMQSLPAHALITYVPTASLRVRQRGYDQAQLLAEVLARLLRVPYMPLLCRVGSQRQVGQKRTVRKQQMATAFRLTRPLPATARHIMLVDDVLTTGATLEAAAAVLRQGGIQQVTAVVFAVAE